MSLSTPTLSDKLRAAAAAPAGASSVTHDRLQRSTHSLRITALLREYIVAGELAPGTPLVESRLAGVLQVSRGPVRNALVELDGEGLVHTESNGRSVVAGFDQGDLEDLLAVRYELESLAVRWGIERERDPAEVRATFDQMVGEGSSNERLVDFDLGFHRQLLEYSGSRALVQSWLRLAPILHAVITVGNRRLGVRAGAFDFERILASHRPIVDAILARDATAAAALLATQFEVTASMYRVDRTEVTDTP